MSPLDRKLVRDFWHIRGLVLAVALVIGTGVATFVMSLETLSALDETRIAYYERYKFADVFATLKRAPDSLAERIGRIPGVKAVQTRIVKGVILDIQGLEEPATGRLISIPERGEPRLNTLNIRAGRSVAPGRPDEVVISEAFAEANGFLPGDSFVAILNGHRRALLIVGVALSPEYVYSIAPGSFMPDDERFGVIWMGHEALAAAFDLEGAFNDVSLALRHGASRRAVIRRLDQVLEPYGGVGAYDQDDQTSNWFLTGDIDQIRNMTTVLPTIFLAVSAFLLHMVVSRLVEAQREQIGLLKAFGYTNAAVGWHFLKLVLAIVALGVVLGCLGGTWLGRVNTELYTQFYRFPFLYYRFDPAVFAGGALISVVAAAAGTFSAVRAAVLLPPAQAMVPPPPPLYRSGWLHRSGLRQTFDPATLMILRHVAHWPLRSTMTTSGIAFALALLISMLHWFDSIDHIIDVDPRRGPVRGCAGRLRSPPRGPGRGALPQRGGSLAQRSSGALAEHHRRPADGRSQPGPRCRARPDRDSTGRTAAGRQAGGAAAGGARRQRERRGPGGPPARPPSQGGRNLRDLHGDARLHGPGGAQPPDAGWAERLWRAFAGRRHAGRRALPGPQIDPAGGRRDPDDGGG
jgi:putative ABC transport system permease protein